MSYLIARLKPGHIQIHIYLLTFKWQVEHFESLIKAAIDSDVDLITNPSAVIMGAVLFGIATQVVEARERMDAIWEVYFPKINERWPGVVEGAIELINRIEPV